MTYSEFIGVHWGLNTEVQGLDYAWHSVEAVFYIDIEIQCPGFNIDIEAIRDYRWLGEEEGRLAAKRRINMVLRKV